MRNTAMITISMMLAGCGSAAISPELRTARDTLDEARSGQAGTLEPDQVRAAERTLMRAEEAPDGSPVEIDLAYIADRQARVAMADAGREATRRAVMAEERRYRQELERATIDRNRAIEEQRHQLALVQRDLAAVRGALSERGQELDERTDELRAREAQLAARERQLLDAVHGRAAAEERADDALARLAEIASVRRETGRTVVTISGEVLFATGRAELLPTARERLRSVAVALREEPEMQISVEGHTDSVGADRRNARLSQRRADAVRRFLIDEGIEERRIQAVGRGEERPISDNTTPEGRANNRRVELVLTPTEA